MLIMPAQYTHCWKRKKNLRAVEVQNKARDKVHKYEPLYIPVSKFLKVPRLVSDR